jgi:hypothetical protein
MANIGLNVSTNQIYFYFLFGLNVLSLQNNDTHGSRNVTALND